ncbi:MAG: serine/threonine protein kinase [Bacilli bacterium]|nr:serine/threonine protein kinase [Bacilli bacterium]
MENINITREEYEYLLSNNISCGEEGAISFYNDRLLKLFFKEGDTGTLEYQLFRDKLENKRRKIDELIHLSGTSDFINVLHPSGIVRYNDHFCGYIMSDYIDSSLYAVDKSKIDTTIKVDILKRYKKILDYFHSIGIVYGDIKSKNLLISSDYSILAFGDLDNIKVRDLPIDNRPVNMVKFCDLYYGLTYDMFMTSIIDSYMFNLLTLEFLLGYSSDNYKQVFDYLESPFNNSCLFDYVEDHAKVKVRSICEELKCINPSYSGRYIVDNL